MSVRWQYALGQRAACRSKRQFGNRPAAEAAIHADQWRHDAQGVVVRPYKCPFCPGWHLTKKPPRKVRP